MRIRRRRRFIFCLVRALQMAATVKGASEPGEGGGAACRQREAHEGSEGRSQKTLEYALLSERVPSSSARGTEGGGRAALSTSAAQSHCIPPSLLPPVVGGREGGDQEAIPARFRSWRELLLHLNVTQNHNYCWTHGRALPRCRDVRSTRVWKERAALNTFQVVCDK